jgi:UDPglucose 6-dehydrogenase
MKLAIVGTGYVGLVTGTCFAEAGNDVVCVDIDTAKVAAMQQGRAPIYEPELETLFTNNIQAGRLHFTTDLNEAVTDAAVIFLALPTPPNGDGSADLSYILNVADQLGPMLKKYAVIVNKSTVPVGTAEKVHAAIAVHASVDFDVVSNPEFLREGLAVQDFMHPDRVVVGTSSERAQKIMGKLYASFTDNAHPLFWMNERSAELTKYAANAFLATKISFINEIANLCDLVGADVDAVRQGIGTDQRIGSRFLLPGIGYGGSCFPKDIRALQKTAADYNYDLTLVDTIVAINERQKRALTKKILRHYKNNLQDKTFALWGLAFKPDTDDTREAPALDMIKELLHADATIVAYDPEANKHVRKQFANEPRLQIIDDQYQALINADALIIATEWEQFKQADLAKIKNALKTPTLFDGRNIYESAKMLSQGFTYISIGRGKALTA